MACPQTPLQIALTADAHLCSAHCSTHYTSPLAAMHEEKRDATGMPVRRHTLSANAAFLHSQQTGGSGGSGSSSAAGGSSLAAVEARLAVQAAQAQAHHDAHVAAQMSGMGPAAPSLPTLPLSSGSAPLRAATLAASLAGQGVNASASDMHALEWADAQFKRAGVSSLPVVSSSSSNANATPIQNLGMHQRLRHVQLFNVVEKLREGQQHIFLEQFNQFPNVESHSADDYSKIWHSFKNKDEEAEQIIGKLNGICENIDVLNRHANHTHS